MTKSRKKKSIWQSRFYQVYFAVVAVILVGIFLGTIWLRGVLKDYESAQPVYVAEDVARLFETRDFNALYEVDTSAEQIAGGDKAFYTQSLSEIASGKRVEWSEGFSGNQDERKYNVTLDGDKFATFTLIPSGETTRQGARLWKLGSVTTLVTRVEPDPTPTPEPTPTPVPQLPVAADGGYGCRVTVPTGYAVTVEGVRLSEGNCKVSPKYMFEDGFLPEGVENPMMTEYVFTVSGEDPTIEVTDAAGVPATLIASAESENTWSCAIPQDSELAVKYSEAALKLGTQIAKFMSKDGSKRSITRLCLKGSPAREIFDNLSNKYATPHTGVEVRNGAATEFYRLADTCFTCRVSFDYVLDTADGERVYPTAYTFCVVNMDGKSGLYNLLIY